MEQTSYFAPYTFLPAFLPRKIESYLDEGHHSSPSHQEGDLREGMYRGISSTSLRKISLAEQQEYPAEGLRGSSACSFTQGVNLAI